MKHLAEYQITGNEFSKIFGEKLVEGIKADKSLSESAILKEDNTMDGGAAFYTTKLAQFVYYKSYNDFKAYFDMVWNLTPSDLGQPDGAGAYKIPKVLAGTAAKLSSGEVVDYLNDRNGSVLLETETFGIGTRINRRAARRYSKPVMGKLMQSASDAVMRAVCTDIANGLIAGAASDNTVTGEISFDKVEQAKEIIFDASDDESIKFGFVPKMIGFTAAGWRYYATDDDVKNAVAMGQRNVPGKELDNSYLIIQELKIVKLPLISVQKGSKNVRAIIVDNDNYACHLNETQMETYDGRLPGTAGDQEIIHALDAGMVAMNTEAAAVVTA